MKQKKCLLLSRDPYFVFPICRQLREILQPRGISTDMVIPGMPHPHSIWRKLKRAAMRANIDPSWVYPHNFRRTCCYWLHKAGVSREEVRSLMGWASDHVMLQHYWPTQSDSEKMSIVNRMA